MEVEMNPFPNEPERAEWKTTSGLFAAAVRLPKGGWYGYVEAPPALGIPDADVLPLPESFEDGFAWHSTTPGEPTARPHEKGWLGFWSSRSLNDVQARCEEFAAILVGRQP